MQQNCTFCAFTNFSTTSALSVAYSPSDTLRSKAFSFPSIFGPHNNFFLWQNWHNTSQISSVCLRLHLRESHCAFQIESHASLFGDASVFFNLPLPCVSIWRCESIRRCESIWHFTVSNNNNMYTVRTGCVLFVTPFWFFNKLRKSRPISIIFCTVVVNTMRISLAKSFSRNTLSCRLNERVKCERVKFLCAFLHVLHIVSGRCVPSSRPTRHFTSCTYSLSFYSSELLNE